MIDSHQAPRSALFDSWKTCDYSPESRPVAKLSGWWVAWRKRLKVDPEAT
jgi:hypothetical protein